MTTIKRQRQPRGNAAGSGRPQVYTLLERMAIYLRVVEVMQQKNIKYKTEAIRFLQRNGELPAEPGVNFGRYLTPKYLHSAIIEELGHGPVRVGIISLIPKPKPDRRRKA